MKIAISFILLLIGALYGCTPKKETDTQENTYLHQQEQQQGYPVLIATPQSASYGLPFCEKQYCIDVEIFSFKSEDTWFNQLVDQKIADLIRQQLGIAQKLSLQVAVNEFVKRSDQWQETQEHQPWSVYIQPRVVAQQGEITVTQIQTEYKLGDQIIPQQFYYFVVDRKNQHVFKLYDMVEQDKRVEFGLYIQQEYEKWRETQENKQQLKPQIYWANQDWFFDDQGIGIYYQSQQLALDTESIVNNNFTIYLDIAHLKRFINKQYLIKLGFLN